MNTSVRNYIRLFVESAEWRSSDYRRPSFRQLTKIFKEKFKYYEKEIERQDKIAQNLQIRHEEGENVDDELDEAYSELQLTQHEFQRWNSAIANRVTEKIIKQLDIKRFNQVIAGPLKYNTSSPIADILAGSDSITIDFLQTFKHAYESLSPQDAQSLVTLIDSQQFVKFAGNLPKVGQRVKLVMFDYGNLDMYKILKNVTGLKNPEVNQLYKGKYKFRIPPDSLSIYTLERIEELRHANRPALIFDYTIGRTDEIYYESEINNFDININVDYVSVSSVYLMILGQAKDNYSEDFRQAIERYSMKSSKDQSDAEADDEE